MEYLYYIVDSVDGKCSVRQRLKGNAVLQHRINQVESDLNGKTICGVLEYAAVFELYKQWRVSM